jgi:putative hemolysin
MRIDTSGNRAVTEEEITASLEEGVDAGLIDQHEHQMVRNVFHLDDRGLASLMVPRSDIQWLDAGFSPAQALQVASGQNGQAGHSWYPVCRGSLDNVLGLISVAKLLSLPLDSTDELEPHINPATFVPETLSGMELLEQLRDQSGRMVLVVDEYGVVQGMMTPRDVLEAITGELLQTSAPEETWATPRGDGSWLLDGLMPISELKARLGLSDLPHEDKGRYNTVAGLVLVLAGRLPRTGERFEGGEYAAAYAPIEEFAPFAEALRAGSVTAEVELYKGVEHGFAFPGRPAYERAAAERHWERLLALYRRTL